MGNLKCPQCSDPDGTKEQRDYRWWFQCLVPGCDFSCQMRFYRGKFKFRDKVKHTYLNTGTFNKEGEPTVEVEVQKHPDINFKKI